MLIPTLITLFAKADIAPRLMAWAGSNLALVALNFTFTVRYPSLDNDSLVAQVVATGFAFQLSMVVMCMTMLNPPVAERLMNHFVHAETLTFLLLGFFGVLLTESLRTAFSKPQPSRLGMLRSAITTSKWVDASKASAATPSRATFTG